MVSGENIHWRNVITMFEYKNEFGFEILYSENNLKVCSRYKYAYRIHLIECFRIYIASHFESY